MSHSVLGIARIAFGGVVASACLLIAAFTPAAARADFGIVPGSFTATANQAPPPGSPRGTLGLLDTQAGSHPYSATTSFTFNPTVDPAVPDQNIKDVLLDLPPGFVGNPTAVPQCPSRDLYFHLCTADSQVGTAELVLNGGPFTEPVFNAVPQPGEAAAFEFPVVNVIAHVGAGVRTGGDYGVRTLTSDISERNAVNAVKLTLWGVPGDPSHDPERGLFCSAGHDCEGGGLPFTGIAVRPFLSNPTFCGPPLRANLSLDSWQSPGLFVTPPPAISPGPTGCGRLTFNPSISLAPDTRQADSPAGLAVDLRVPQTDSPNTLASPQLRNATVTLPQGIAVNPSSADGLGGCTPTQVDLLGPGPTNCPDASKIGSVEVRTPLLDHPLPGRVFLGTPECAPCGNADAQAGRLVKLYIEVNDPVSGVIVKLPGSGKLDPTTGQITASFEENPQLPFEDLNLTFKGGPRATLTTPPACGHYTTTTDLEPWSAPQSGPDATPQSGFDLSSGPNGSACVASEAQSPNRPAFEAGTATPIAGSYSPFVLKLSREDGSQRISSIDTTLPEGLLGRLAGIAYCSDAAITAASSKGGASEKAAPSCPLASEVGVVTVGAGSGSPYYVQGHAYLSGPYKAAPLSLEIITPAVAGPFDLGTVAVRTALYVNETTAQIHAVSDPIPSILAGIPLDVRSIALNMNRPNFTLNPTSCEPQQVIGSATSTLGNVAPLQNRFQVGACGALGFKPRLAIKLKGGTRRHTFPALTATLTYPRGSSASTKTASVALPHSEFLEQGHIKTICTRVQFAAGAGHGTECPAASIYGHATAFTPLLDQPLDGPVYLRSSSHKLPDLVAALNGQIDITLSGKIDTDKADGIRTTFENAPDAPVSKFILRMQGGKKGLLVNSENICSKPQRATVKLTAQDNKIADSSPLIANDCKKHGRKKHKAKAHGRHDGLLHAG
jgi:hypothetical protein